MSASKAMQHLVRQRLSKISKKAWFQTITNQRRPKLKAWCFKRVFPTNEARQFSKIRANLVAALEVLITCQVTSKPQLLNSVHRLTTNRSCKAQRLKSPLARLTHIRNAYRHKTDTKLSLNNRYGTLWTFLYLMRMMKNLSLLNKY